MTNRLAETNSPYLLQHAENPVDWYPWGEEAFEKAREEDKPVFLSIGYSTCHWCHVMAHESFEDDEIAKYLNEHFVSIKVDREERPDLDNIYMKTCQMMSGSGGWPLSIFLTPEKKPFFAGTYFPKDPQRGRIGFQQLLNKMNSLWKNQRDKVSKSAREITKTLQKTVEPDREDTDSSSKDLLDSAFDQISQQYDEKFGGFGQAPKFPSPHMLLFLLRYWNRTGEDEALNMVTETLDHMRYGGIYDQLGFGFHRYSTDRQWLLPHFEKMLYDQALHLIAYSEAYQATEQSRYKKTAREMTDYLFRIMQSPEGGFYSAEDADTEGEEGKFYVWSEDELEEILSGEQAELARHLFHTNANGNFREESTGKRTGKNILHLQHSLEEHADHLDMDEGTLRDHYEDIRSTLLEARQDRKRPHKDQKILADWNGLLLGALAKCGRHFNDESLSDRAEELARFLLEHFQREDGTLMHRYRDGEVGITGNLDDYAFLTYGLLELYETTLQTEWLQEAVQLIDQQTERFWDEENGSFYFSEEEQDDLIVRSKELHDGALPAGNSMALLNFARLYQLTGNTDYRDKARNMTEESSGLLEGAPHSFSMFLTGLEQFTGSHKEVALTGSQEKLASSPLLQTLRNQYAPYLSILRIPSDDEEKEQLEDLASFTASIEPNEDQPRARVCTDFSCREPTDDPDTMMEQLEE